MFDHLPSSQWASPAGRLAANLSALANSLTVRNANAFSGKPVPFEILLGTEIMTVTSMAGVIWQLDRAKRDTLAQPHFAPARLVAL
jgi:hypothetical protein